MSVFTSGPNATLETIIEMLKEQEANKIDVVAPATAVRSRGGAIELSGVDPVVDENGVTIVDGLYVPTARAVATIAAKLGIPAKYLRRLREERPDLFDANVNGWLHGKVRRSAAGESTVVYEADERSFLLRMFRGANGEHGVMRAMLSDRYGIIDNLDVLTAILDGIRQADAAVEIRSCALSDTSMHCKVYSPTVAKLAPQFLAGYRTPFDNPELEAERRNVLAEVDQWRRVAADEGMGYAPGDEPVVFAGFRFSNSEIGAGSVTLKPELCIKICGNGLTLPMLKVSKIHMGVKLEAGAVRWSQDTYNKHLAVVTAEARDAVQEWLSPEFLGRQIDEIEQRAGAPVLEPAKTITVVAKQHGFTEAEREGILAHFIAGSQLTAAGIANAITSYSQTVVDGDRADHLDDCALAAMALVS